MSLTAKDKKSTRYPELTKIEWLVNHRHENKKLTQEEVIAAIDEEWRHLARVDGDWVWFLMDVETAFKENLEQYFYGLGFFYSPKRKGYYHRCGHKNKKRR